MRSPVKCISSTNGCGSQRVHYKSGKSLLQHSLCHLSQAVGTQGDVVPFIAVALKLREDGHRVRIATHAPLRRLVERYGLEFFPLGGDPQKLAYFAVHNKGVQPVSPALYSIAMQ